MKRMALIFLCSTLLSGAFMGLASAQSTAFGALLWAGKSAPNSQLARIVGVRGSPQPAEWKFYYLDASARGGIREVTIANRELVSIRTPLRGFSDLGSKSPIPLTSLRVDSDRAFQIANAQATENRISFHWVDYALEMSPTGSPQWALRLLNNLGAAVGSLKISAETGAVTVPIAREDVGFQPSPDSSSKPIGGVIGDARDLGVNVGRRVSDTTLRTIGAVQKFLTGERTIGPSDEDSQ